jgi:hypothetical protein
VNSVTSRRNPLLLGQERALALRMSPGKVSDLSIFQGAKFLENGLPFLFGLLHNSEVGVSQKPAATHT